MSDVYRTDTLKSSVKSLSILSKKLLQIANQQELIQSMSLDLSQH